MVEKVAPEGRENGVVSSLTLIGMALEIGENGIVSLTLTGVVLELLVLSSHEMGYEKSGSLHQLPIVEQNKYGTGKKVCILVSTFDVIKAILMLIKD